MSLKETWNTAAGSPFQPTIGKGSQLYLGLILILVGTVLTVSFGLNRSLTSVATLGLPASIAFGFGAVYTICGVGVYV